MTTLLMKTYRSLNFLHQSRSLVQPSSLPKAPSTPSTLNQSFLIRNRLTKRTFSFSDTGFSTSHISPQRKIRVAPATSRKELVKSRFEINTTFEDIQPGVFHRTSHLQELLFATKRSKISESHSKERKFKNSVLETTSNAKPLISAHSQHRINRINTRIDDTVRHHRFLSSLIPEPRAEKIKPQIKPRGTIVPLDRIEQLIRTLVGGVELFYQIYHHDLKVAVKMKQIEGFNKSIQMALFRDDRMMQRIDQAGIQRLRLMFWVSKPANERPLHYGEEDLALYSTLNNYALKMESKADDFKNAFGKGEQQVLREKFSRLDEMTKQTEHPLCSELTGIRKFVQNRLRVSTDKRTQSMQVLHKLGVKLNIGQVSREEILTKRETAFTQEGNLSTL